MNTNYNWHTVSWFCLLWSSINKNELINKEKKLPSKQKYKYLGYCNGVTCYGSVQTKHQRTYKQIQLALGADSWFCNSAFINFDNLCFWKTNR